MTVLVTGSAGFIGNSVTERLLIRGERVIGIDNLNSYYDVSLKKARLARISDYEGFTECRIDLADRDAVAKVFEEHRPDQVINLAAQAGVRYSLENPHAYVDTNLVGFLNVLEGCRNVGVKHFVYASSSSVYGDNPKQQSVNNPVDHPLSLYAATKRSNELMAHTYSHLFGINSTGLRFFTVYGPWGRPDMALFIFAKAILEGRPIEVFNMGQMKRAFTYIDDIVEGVIRVLDRAPVSGGENAEGPASSKTAPFCLYNIGLDRTESLLRYIELLEAELGMEAEKIMKPIQPGDVPATWADVSDLKKDFDWQPVTRIEVGIRNFVNWYREYYKV
jgi:UDP-glucuronate 4-epimerase